MSQVPAFARQTAEAAGLFAGHGARRRQHRRQRRGPAAHHRGVPAQSEYRPAIRSMSRARHRTRAARFLGADRVIWLRNGIAGDDTHGHVDDLARFVGAGHGGARRRARSLRPNYEPLRENLAILRAAGLRRRQTAHAASRWYSPGSGCRPATRISISPTGWCWCRRSTIRTTASRSTRWPAVSRTAKSRASTARN